MSAIQYTRLPESSPPRVSIERLSATTIYGQGGRQRLRIRFLEPGLDFPEYNIAALEPGPFSCCRKISGKYFRFAVSQGGEAQSVWLHETSLRRRLMLDAPGFNWYCQSHPNNLLAIIQRNFLNMPAATAKSLTGRATSIRGASVWASRQDIMRHSQISERLLARHSSLQGLNWIIQMKELVRIPHNLALQVQQENQPVHFSRKDWKFLPGSLYVTARGTTFYGVSEQLAQGYKAPVKTAKNSDNCPVARKICVVNRCNRDEVDRGLNNLQQLQSRVGVIELLGHVEYTSLYGKCKLVTFLPKGTSLDDYLASHNYQSITWQQRCALAAQMFTALQSLNGAHGDLMPSHIILLDDPTSDTPSLKLTSFQGYLPADAANIQQNLCTRYGWAAPEAMQPQNIVVSKFDVWPAGFMLLYILFPPSATKQLPVTVADSEDQDPKMIYTMNQPTINTILSQCCTAAGQPQFTPLLQNMIAIDVSTRYTIKEAAQEFRKITPAGPNS